MDGYQHHLYRSPNAFSGTLTVANDAGDASVPFQVLPRIESITPEFGFNDGTVEITDLAGSGFYASGAYPRVKLDNGTVEIPATDIQVRSPHDITCRFNIEGATPGFYGVTVENADGGSDTLYGGSSSITIRPPCPASLLTRG